MKKTVIITSIFTILFVFNHTSISQPLVTVHLFGGYAMPISSLKGNVFDSLTTNYRTKNGFGVGGDAKFGLGKTRAIRLTFSAAYFSFSNTSDSVINTIVGNEKVVLNDVQFGLGAELALNPKGMLDPFIGAEITANIFSGSDNFDNPDVNHKDGSLNVESRYGLNLGAGLDFMLFKKSGLGGVVGVKAHWANLFGRKVNNTAAAGTTYYLNDDINSKTIAFVTFYAGLTFEIGNPTSKRK